MWILFKEIIKKKVTVTDFDSSLGCVNVICEYGVYMTP